MIGIFNIITSSTKVAAAATYMILYYNNMNASE
jgi:hypothetical protein